MSQTLKQLYIVYYAIYVVAFLVAIYGNYILNSGISIDPLSSEGTLINSIVIMYIICTVPFTLAIFNKYSKKWAQIEDVNLKLLNYKKWGTLRIFIIGIGLIMGVIFFYIMRSQTMIFCAAIAALGLIFCKPSQIKLINELNIDEDINLNSK
jgi:hypothetical protein